MLLGTMKMAAGILGLTGVVFGALGAHALKARLAAAGMSEAWGTAVQYHLTHAVALLALAAFTASATDEADSAHRRRWFSRVAWAWFVGSILFSGSLYILALGGPRWLGPVTPVGGVALLVGWACLLFSGRNRGFSGRSARE